MNGRVARVLAVGAAGVVLLLLAAGWWQGLLSAGRTVGFSFPRLAPDAEFWLVVPDGPADRAGIRAGDILVAIGDSAITDKDDYDLHALGFRRGEPVSFTVRRGDDVLQLAVRPGMPFDWLRFLLNALITLGYLAVGVIALVQAPDDLRARLLFGFGVSVAVEFSLPGTLLTIPHWDTIRNALFLLLTGLQMGLELHLASVIPRPNPWFESRRWLAPTFYATGLCLGGVSSASVVTEAIGRPTFPWSAAQAEDLLMTWGLPLWALAVVGILLAQTRIARDPTHRNQALLVLLGVLPWAAYTLITEFAYAFGSPTRLASSPLESVVILMYPVAVFVAIFRYHLFDIELVLKRSMVYGIVTTTLILVFYVALSFGSALFAHQIQGASAVWAVSSIMLLLGLLFAPLRRVVQGMVDRRLFPERLAMRQRLTELAGQLPSHGNLPAMGQELVSKLTEIFRLSSATILVADPSTGVLVTLASSAVNLDERFGQSFLLPPDDPGVQLLARAGRPLRAELLLQHSGALGQRMAAFDAELALGLRSGGSVVGVLLLGPKADNERFPAEELELLSLFSHTIASVLENAHLYESATYDSLTGLLRREAILAALGLEFERALRYQRPLAVAMADIDHFKRVNDTHGHLAGDALLKRVAQTLKGGLRGSDAIGRYGGEEFLFFLPETDIDGAVRVAEKLRLLVEGMDSPVEGAEDVGITISIGLTGLEHGSESTQSVEALIAAADERLLAAKRQGRNRVIPGPAAAA